MYVSNNIYTYHINNLESYTPNILKNTTYYFDLSDVYATQFKLSLYNDGLNNNIISEYNNSTDFMHRSTLYEHTIRPALSEMVDKIVYTYKFNNLPNIKELQDDCKVWLVTILHKYNPDKGSKAFSYFSVITKNWFIHKVKKNTQQYKREISLENHLSMDMIGGTQLCVEDDYYARKEKEEYMELLRQEIQSWDSATMRPNERKVYQAIITLLDNAEKLEIFNKKAIYLYLREITGLNTKQIVAQLSKMRKKYSDFKHNYENGVE